MALMWSWGPRWVCRDRTEGTLWWGAGVLAELPLGQRGHTRQAALTGDGMTGERTQKRGAGVCTPGRWGNADLLSGGTLSLCGHPDRLR